LNVGASTRSEAFVIASGRAPEGTGGASALARGNIRELREVLALAESGRLTPIPLEFWPLAKINDVYERVKHGKVAGRAVITPSAASA
jgi:hypothetical protein